MLYLLDLKVKPEIQNGRTNTPEAKTKSQTFLLNGSTSSPMGSLFPVPLDGDKHRVPSSGSAGVLLQSFGAGSGGGQAHLFPDHLPDNSDKQFARGSGAYFVDVIRNLSEYSSSESAKSVLDSYYLSSMHAIGRGGGGGTDNTTSSLLQYTPDASPNVGCASTTGGSAMDLPGHLQCSVLYGTSTSPSRPVYLASCKPDHHPRSLPSISEFGITLDRRSY